MDMTLQYNNCSGTKMWLEGWGFNSFLLSSLLLLLFFFLRVHPLHDSHLRYQERQQKKKNRKRKSWYASEFLTEMQFSEELINTVCMFFLKNISLYNVTEKAQKKKVIIRTTNRFTVWSLIFRHDKIPDRKC